jgi:hypothetical protein
VKIMVIPEDPTIDQYILKPIVEQLFADLGKSPRVHVLSKPRLRGVPQALDASILADIVDTNRMIDLFLVLVDRDADTQKRPAVAREREREHVDRLFVCLAIEEIEVWMLALHREALDAPWKEIRTERDPKELYAHPFLAQRAPKLGAGAGRAWAMRDLGAKWKGLLEVCPELAELRQCIESWLDRRG